jgi:chromosome segregation ATPase
MLAGTSVDLNQLQELVTAYQTSDNDILAQITNISTNISNIQNQLNNLESVVTTLVNDTNPP